MKANEILKEIRVLIAQDEIKGAIKKLQMLLQGSTLLDELILHSGRYNGVMKEIRLNLISFEEAEMAKSSVRYALTDMLREIEERAETDPKIFQEVEKVHAQNTPTITIKNSKNVNTGNVNTGGGDFIIGDR